MQHLCKKIRYWTFSLSKLTWFFIHCWVLKGSLACLCECQLRDDTHHCRLLITCMRGWGFGLIPADYALSDRMYFWSSFYHECKGFWCHGCKRDWVFLSLCSSNFGFCCMPPGPPIGLSWSIAVAGWGGYAAIVFAFHGWDILIIDSDLFIGNLISIVYCPFLNIKSF